ncbi:MAG TPA: PPE family protein [Mycobacterium sp.]|nr:PPE family protein [Mycobacterium sp.]HUB56725.1 PPE family protein [Mycobacterium sp.]
MEFTTLPPEITSALIHSGPGAESLVAASGAWQQLGVNLEDSAENYAATLSSLIEIWQGPSSAAMAQAVQPYLTWLQTTAQQAQQTASSAMAAAAAFNAARAAVVPTAEVVANRMQLVELLATNGFGRNLPAIAENEAQYQSMWANNSAAMNRYEAASSQATTLPQFTSPAATTNPTGQTAQSKAVSAAATNSGPTTAAASPATPLPPAGDPNSGYIGLANTYANQFVSSGFPLNLLSYLAQNQSAQALQGVNAQIGQGVSEGESALGGGLGGGGAAGALGGLGGLGQLGPGALGAAGLGQASTSAATGVGVSIGKLTAPPSVVNLLPSSQAPVQLASAATPLGAGESGMPMLPPLMPPPISPAGSGWRKRKQQKYEDVEIGAELKGTVIRPPPSAG